VGERHQFEHLLQARTPSHGDDGIECSGLLPSPV